MSNPKRILVIEDEEDIAEIIRMDLRSKGYTVDLAYDGEEGLNKARTTNPDLIVLDLRLPKLDGYQVCQSLKSDDNYKQIPIILLTVSETKEEADQGYAAGADAYIVKPYRAKNLLAIVESFLQE